MFRSFRSMSIAEYKSKLAQVQDANLSSSLRYVALQDIGEVAGFGEDIDVFVSVGGVKILVDLACTGWPQNGRLAASQLAIDAVQNMVHPDKTNVVLNQNGVSLRSLRRVVIAILAEMTNYGPYVRQMERSGFFAAAALPTMLEQTMPLIDYPLHNKMYAYEEAVDQSQAVAVRLLQIAANAVPQSKILWDNLKEGGALIRICSMFQDPMSQWVAKAAAERKLRTTKLKSKGWTEQRISHDIQELKDKQHNWEEQHFDEAYKQPEGEGLVACFVKLFNRVVQLCMKKKDEPFLLQHIHEGGLINKLKGCMPLEGCPAYPTAHRPGFSVSVLCEYWTNKCHTLSDELYHRIEADEARSTQLRLSGNTAFKEGRLPEALKFYYKAVALNPEDASLFNNISLVYYKLGKAPEALEAAHESLKPDPANSKSWVRVGDAYRLDGKWQLAHLSYTAALELSPGNEEYQARQSEARDHLAVIWDIDKDVPHSGTELMTAKYMEWTGLSAPDVMKIVTGGNDDELDKLLHTSRGQACMVLKGDIEDMRAVAVATGVISPTRLPASCRVLKRLHEIRSSFDHWSLSWTDMPLKHPETGLIRHTITCMSNQTCQVMGSLMTLGTPGWRCVRRLLITAISVPSCIGGQGPSKPESIFVAHRMFPIFSKIAEFCKQHGITAIAETAAEAQRSAAHNDTEWTGLNNLGEYQNANPPRPLYKNGRDPNNGHKEGAFVAATSKHNNTSAARARHATVTGTSACATPAVTEKREACKDMTADVISNPASSAVFGGPASHAATGSTHISLAADNEAKESKRGRSEAKGVCVSCGVAVSKIRRCSGCKQVVYCSKECQVADWKEHRKTCGVTGDGGK